MKILVCAKQVPDPDVDLRLTTDNAVETVRDAYVMNRLDEYAMEEALCLCESLGQGSVEAVTVGPERASSTARRAMAMGAQSAVHILTGEKDILAGFGTASLIAAYAKDKGYDLILAGVMSEDLMAGAVGPMIAGILGLPWITSAVSLHPVEGGKAVRVTREGEGGAPEILEMDLPALATIQSGAQKPRYPNLTNMLRANKQPLEQIKAQDLGEQEARETILGAFPPRQRGQGVFLEGSTQEKAKQLAIILKERALL